MPIPVNINPDLTTPEAQHLCRVDRVVDGNALLLVMLGLRDALDAQDRSNSRLLRDLGLHQLEEVNYRSGHTWQSVQDALECDLVALGYQKVPTP